MKETEISRYKKKPMQKDDKYAKDGQEQGARHQYT
jgi:hypothetical protein